LGGRNQLQAKFLSSKLLEWAKTLNVRPCCSTRQRKCLTCGNFLISWYAGNQFMSFSFTWCTN
jgi:hypothetical protein